MSIDLATLDNGSRLLVEAELSASRGTGGRFQPTGFPDLGPALYRAIESRTDPDGSSTPKPVDMLLVESVQSMANRLEEVCLDGEDYNADCRGIPYVRVLDGHRNNEFLTSSVREPHRLNSKYVMEAKVGEKTYQKVLGDALHVNKQRPVHMWKLVPIFFERDPGCVLHGVFCEKIDGRIRLPRLLSGYVEAKDPNPANSGGVYRGEVTAKDNIPYARQEFTSRGIRATFIIHLGTLHSYSLPEERRRFLQLWALYKIDRFLHQYLRLRSACEFEVGEISTNLDGKKWKFDADNNAGSWPNSTEIQDHFTKIKAACFPTTGDAKEFSERNVVVVKYTVDVKGEEPLPEGVTAADFNLSGFEERAEIKEIEIGRKKEKVLSLVLFGEWSDKEDQDQLLGQNPVTVENEDGEAQQNVAHKVIKGALKKWNDKWEKERKRAGVNEESEE